MSNEVKMIGVIVAVCVVLLGTFVWFAPKEQTGPADQALLVKTDSHMTGVITAKVTLVEFADFQCPACATVAPYLKGIVDSYKNNPDFNYVYRNFPLSQHANAVISAEAAESAGVQGKFWEMAALLYEKQTEWSEVKLPTDLFVSYAQTLGLDTVKFKADIDSHRFQVFIKADLADAQSLALSHTPFLFLNGLEVKDLNTLKAQIDVELAK